MLKKTINYTDYDGNERTEDFYFNLTKAELTRMFASVDGGLDKYLTRILQAQRAPEIMGNFQKILKESYGVKSDDGRRFMKSDELWKDFLETEAYSVLFMELCTDSKKMSEFIYGIIPADVKKQVEEEAEVAGKPTLLKPVSS